MRERQAASSHRDASPVQVRAYGAAFDAELGGQLVHPLEFQQYFAPRYGFGNVWYQRLRSCHTPWRRPTAYSSANP